MIHTTTTTTTDDIIAKHYYETMQTWNDTPLKERSYRILVNVLLISSFLYYHLDFSILSDSQFDSLCSYLLAHYDDLLSSRAWHLKLMSKESLRAGSFHTLRGEDYPPILVSICYALIRIGVVNDACEEVYSPYSNIESSSIKLPSPSLSKKGKKTPRLSSTTTLSF